MYPQERFAYYKRPFWPVLCLKRIGLPCCILISTIVTSSLQIILLSNYSLLIVSALANITLLKTTCHFLLLLVGFNTLTYRKELQLIPPRTLCDKSTPRGRTLCGRLFLPFGSFGFRIPGRSPFPPHRKRLIELNRMPWITHATKIWTVFDASSIANVLHLFDGFFTPQFAIMASHSVLSKGL